MTLRVHPDIASLSPYVPGKPIEELQRELGLSHVIKLASNENPLGPSPRALAVLSEGAATLHRYPDGGAFRLREALADRWKVTSDHVILGNGSDEILGLLARSFLSPGDEAVMADQTFVIYKMEVTAAQHELDLFFGEVEVHRGKRQCVEGEIPGRIPRILPLVRHGED